MGIEPPVAGYVTCLGPLCEEGATTFFSKDIKKFRLCKKCKQHRYKIQHNVDEDMIYDYGTGEKYSRH